MVECGGGGAMRRSGSVLLVVGAIVLAGVPAAAGTPGPGAPGMTSYFDTARKDCVGTARGSGSKVWYTVA
ncbi:MAG: hypothetical protein JO285_07525, partial [Kutzneria sp.]|nr:hypothetical protein [Kutzneria sp.]